MKRLISMLAVTAITVGVFAAPVAAAERTRIGVDASEWDSATVPGGGIYPIGGSGQINAEFVTGELNGIQIGIRAQERFIGPLTAAKGKKGVGVYQAETGTSSPGRAWWNYDLHVDLREPRGVAKGKTLDDYDLTLETDIGLCPTACSLGGFFPGGVLVQQSYNPNFFSLPFDFDAEATYNFTLSLTPKTFNGPPIHAKMRVVVTVP